MCIYRVSLAPPPPPPLPRVLHSATHPAPRRSQQITVAETARRQRRKSHIGRIFGLAPRSAVAPPTQPSHHAQTYTMEPTRSILLALAIALLTLLAAASALPLSPLLRPHRTQQQLGPDLAPPTTATPDVAVPGAAPVAYTSTDTTTTDPSATRAATSRWLLVARSEAPTHAHSQRRGRRNGWRRHVRRMPCRILLHGTLLHGKHQLRTPSSHGQPPRAPRSSRNHAAARSPLELMEGASASTAYALAISQLSFGTISFIYACSTCNF